MLQTTGLFNSIELLLEKLYLRYKQGFRFYVAMKAKQKKLKAQFGKFFFLLRTIRIV